MIDSGNTAWILTSTALVLLMTLPGLALFYAGLVQAKNALSVLMHCITIAALATVFWVRSEEHTSELQSLMRTSYAVFCLKKKSRVCHTSLLLSSINSNLY